MPIPAKPEDILSLVLDELWDLTDAIDELETRRARLQEHVLAACRAQGADRVDHPGGTVLVHRHASYRVRRTRDALSLVVSMGWEDKALQVDGRALLALADANADARAMFDALFERAQHETLTLMPKRRG